MMLENMGSWWKGFSFQNKKKSPTNERLIKAAQLQVKNTLESVAIFLDWFEQFQVLEIPDYLWYAACQTALVEALTNVVRHAHKNLPESIPIDIEVKLFSSYIEMCIWDYGPPFDMEKKFQEKLAAFRPGEPEDNGNGLIFMYKLTDELYYTRLPDDERNCLLMRKKFVSD